LFGAKVFVLGNASIDLRLTVPRLPRPGETLMAHGISRTPGGKGLNQAVVAARCGAHVYFCAPLGTEPEAELVRAALAGEGFAGLVLPDIGQPTDLSMLLVGEDAENSIVSTGDCAFGLNVATAETFLADLGPEDVLLVQGNLTEAATLAAVRRSPRAIFNAAPIRWTTEAVARHCAVVIANQGEAEEMTGLADPRRAVTRLGGAIGIVTWGGEGCLVARDGVVTHYKAPKVQPVDTTGAGDTFCGVLAARLAQGATLDAAIAAAQLAAALAVSRAGCYAALPTRAELSRSPPDR
jgi:ribokinase